MMESKNSTPTPETEDKKSPTSPSADGANIHGADKNPTENPELGIKGTSNTPTFANGDKKLDANDIKWAIAWLSLIVGLTAVILGLDGFKAWEKAIILEMPILIASAFLIYRGKRYIAITLSSLFACLFVTAARTKITSILISAAIQIKTALYGGRYYLCAAAVIAAIIVIYSRYKETVNIKELLAPFAKWLNGLTRLRSQPYKMIAIMLTLIILGYIRLNLSSTSSLSIGLGIWVLIFIIGTLSVMILSKNPGFRATVLCVESVVALSVVEICILISRFFQKSTKHIVIIALVLCPLICSAVLAILTTVFQKWKVLIDKLLRNTHKNIVNPIIYTAVIIYLSVLVCVVRWIFFNDPGTFGMMAAESLALTTLASVCLVAVIGIVYTAIVSISKASGGGTKRDGKYLGFFVALALIISISLFLIFKFKFPMPADKLADLAQSSAAALFVISLLSYSLVMLAYITAMAFRGTLSVKTFTFCDIYLHNEASVRSLHNIISEKRFDEMILARNKLCINPADINDAKQLLTNEQCKKYLDLIPSNAEFCNENHCQTDLWLDAFFPNSLSSRTALHISYFAFRINETVVGIIHKFFGLFKQKGHISNTFGALFGSDGLILGAFGDLWKLFTGKHND